jgi:hypothetical protein
MAGIEVGNRSNLLDFCADLLLLEISTPRRVPGF